MTASRQLAALGLAMIVLTLAGLALHQPGAVTLPSLRLTWLFVGLMAVAAGGYFRAVALVLRQPLPARSLWLVLAVALVLRVLVLPVPPFLSSDMFRYVWDGMVQNAGINPYRFIPADPALAALRDPFIYPHVNRASYALTAYPPAAELVFRAIAAIRPGVLAMKVAMLGFDLLAIVAVMAVLARAGLPRQRVLIYAWNPLAVWAFAGNAHVDAIAVGLIGVALLARLRQRDGLAGALLGAAILVKFLPAAIAPALWRRGDWRLPVACLAVIVALYGCYSGVGWQVFGFLPGYAAEEGIDKAGGLWLAGVIGALVPLAPRVYLAAAGAGLLALGVWVALRPRAPADPGRDIVRVAGDAAMLAAATTVVLSPHYAWYYAWLALPCCICPLRSVIYLSAAGLLLYVNPLNEHVLWPSLLFVPALVLAVPDFRRLVPGRLGAPEAAIGRSP
ncbi:MAG TPA: glycosyltransferase 87 family protein [Acetobacteraceae bacterium]|nr:glycosyltransferase 87 family protein [Acetobacteraceae bacterium]